MLVSISVCRQVNMELSQNKPVGMFMVTTMNIPVLPCAVDFAVSLVISIVPLLLVSRIK